MMGTLDPWREEDIGMQYLLLIHVDPTVMRSRSPEEMAAIGLLWTASIERLASRARISAAFG